MNRTEALQAAIDIAGRNVTAEEHIQYAEFLLGGESTAPEMMSTWQIVDGREYTPHDFIGQPVYPGHWNKYRKGAIAIDHQGDVWHHNGGGAWSLYDEKDGSPSNPEEFATATVKYWGGVFVA